MMSKTAATQCNTCPDYGNSMWLICLLASGLLLLSGCAGLPQSALSDNTLEDHPLEANLSSQQYQEMSYAEYVFRRQNDVADRCMFLVDENTQLTDLTYEAIQQREESMYEACRHINEMARIRSQQEEESWLLKLKILFTLGECEIAANELDLYLLNLQTEKSPTALGAL